MVEHSALDAPILLGEVKKVVAKLKRGKAAGEDTIVNELFKYGGERAVEAAWRMMVVVWDREELGAEGVGTSYCRPILQSGR